MKWWWWWSWRCAAVVLVVAGLQYSQRSTQGHAGHEGHRAREKGTCFLDEELVDDGLVGYYDVQIELDAKGHEHHDKVHAIPMMQ